MMMRKLRSYLYQGDISDLRWLKEDERLRQKYKITLAIAVGYQFFSIPDTFSVHVPMKDEEEPGKNRWEVIADVVRLAVKEVKRGGRLLVTCDMGVSRSVVFSGMVISALESRPMDESLLREVWIDESMPPLEELWKTAAKKVPE